MQDWNCLFEIIGLDDFLEFLDPSISSKAPSVSTTATVVCLFFIPLKKDFSFSLIPDTSFDHKLFYKNSFYMNQEAQN